MGRLVPKHSLIEDDQLVGLQVRHRHESGRFLDVAPVSSVAPKYGTGGDVASLQETVLGLRTLQKARHGRERQPQPAEFCDA